MCTKWSTVTIFKPDKSGWNCWRDKLVLEPNRFDPQKWSLEQSRLGLPGDDMMTSYQRWWWKTSLKHLRTSKRITSLRIGVKFLKKISETSKKRYLIFSCWKVAFSTSFVRVICGLGLPYTRLVTRLQNGTIFVPKPTGETGFGRAAGDTFMTWSAGNP